MAGVYRKVCEYPQASLESEDRFEVEYSPPFLPWVLASPYQLYLGCVSRLGVIWLVA